MPQTHAYLNVELTLGKYLQIVSLLALPITNSVETVHLLFAPQFVASPHRSSKPLNCPYKPKFHDSSFLVAYSWHPRRHARYERLVADILARMSRGCYGKTLLPWNLSYTKHQKNCADCKAKHGTAWSQSVVGVREIQKHNSWQEIISPATRWRFALRRQDLNRYLFFPKSRFDVHYVGMPVQI